MTQTTGPSLDLTSPDATSPDLPSLDLTVTRIIKAPKSVVWAAWTTPSQLEQWWVPSPSRARVVELDLRAGGAFTTEISEGADEFGPHIDGCFLAVEEGSRIVFTNALVAEWRPANDPFITAHITFTDHPEGTEYTARVLHKNAADAEQHVNLGFFDGWGTVTGQLAEFAEGLDDEQEES